MNNVIGYLDYKCPSGKIEKIINKVFCKVSTYKNEYGEFVISTNADIINERALNRLSKKINEKGISKVVLSNRYLPQKDTFKNYKIDVFDGKILMKNMLRDILEYIYQIKNIGTFNDELYVLLDSDKNADIIEDVATMFKSLNIVTSKIKKLKRLEKKLEGTTDLVYSITNNKKKGLRRAKIIVNMDYDSDFFKEARVNRNAIVINLSRENLTLKCTFCGLIIENISIEYSQNAEELEQFRNFNKGLLMETKILKENYRNARNILKKSHCKLAGLEGKNGEVSEDEIKNNLS